jgi:hypothetical protein
LQHLFQLPLRAFLPGALVAQYAANARSRNAASAAVGAAALRCSSSQFIGRSVKVSICLAHLSLIGLDDLIWLHMLGEICKSAANASSRPFGEAPFAKAFSG